MFVGVSFLYVNSNGVAVYTVDTGFMCQVEIGGQLFKRLYPITADMDEVAISDLMLWA